MPELIPRATFERELAESLAATLERAKQRLVTALYREGLRQGDLMNAPPDVLDDLRHDIQRDLQQRVPPVFIETARQFAGLLSFALDEAELQTAAQTWVQSWLPALVDGMLNTTTAELQRIASTAPDVPLDRRGLLGILGGGALFGLARAMTTARTTTTEINSAAEDAITAKLNQSGNIARIEEIHYTKLDERVCPVCLPLHGKLLEPADKRPPLHPNCRCERRYRITYSDGTVAVVRASEERGKPVVIE